MERVNRLERGSRFGKKREFLKGLLQLYYFFEQSDKEFVTGQFVTRDKVYTFRSKQELLELIEKVKHG